jgi:hypothetical protein
MRYLEETIYSPFSGLAADIEGEINEKDPTLLFIYYGNTGDYAYVSERIKGLIQDDIESVDVETLPSMISIDGGFVLRIDADWNGVNYIGFAPAS